MLLAFARNALRIRGLNGHNKADYLRACLVGRIETRQSSLAMQLARRLLD
jgi:hypothetical protein